MKHYTVTAAILTNENEILCMQRPKSKYEYISYKFEFPGGKVEENESNEEGLSSKGVGDEGNNFRGDGC